MSLSQAVHPDHATAFWTLAPGRGALCRQELPAPVAGDVRVRALASGISRGTESLVFQGRVPAELAAIMRCPFQEGEFPGPVKYGYALVGMVEQGPAGLLGRRVFALHPHQDVALLPAESCRLVPDAVPTERAVLAANMETALNILWDGGAAPGQRIAVVGGGVVGGLTAWLAACLPGAEVTLVDIDPARAALADALGAGFALPDDAPDGCDLVIHTSATGDGLATALRLAGVEAVLVEASWYGDRPVTVPLGSGFHPNRLRIVSSQVGMVSPAFRPRWTLSRRLEKALSLLTDPAADHLLGPRLDFSDLPAAMAGLHDLPFGCPVVRYPRPNP
ncbi:zinc-dependent alcohol dehydrogenase [Niveispirillum fermenti]|uniref:zinc-dependent alcohol dehydrogenase n=1 Tax=Niveispirillum fermenti TaxID=1233113 RepID=UPI003A8AA925